MIIGKTDVTPKSEPRRRKSASPRRIHSIAGLLKGRSFTGSFQSGGARYRFAYEPKKAEVRDGKLYLRGEFTVRDPRDRMRSLNAVDAVLIAAQGGIGTPPPRPATSVAPKAASTAAPQPELEARASNSDVTAAGAVAAQAQTAPHLDIDGTGALSFCGALYFRLELVNSRALGITAGLSHVQLNARLLATDDRERALHGVYSALADALLRDKVEARAATDLVGRLNKLLG